MSEKKFGRIIHKVLAGDGYILETSDGPIEICVRHIKSKVADISIRAPLSVKFTAIHMNPHRGEAIGKTPTDEEKA